MKKLVKAIANTKVTYRGDTVILDRRQWEVIEKLAADLTKKRKGEHENLLKSSSD